MSDIPRARALRELKWTPIPLEHAEAYGIKLQPIQYVVREHPNGRHELSDECDACNEGSEDDNACTTCFKLMSHTDGDGNPHVIYSDAIGRRVNLTREDCCPYG